MVHQELQRKSDFSPHECQDCKPIMDLCAELFREPQRLVKAHTFPVPNNVAQHVPPHYHPDLLQIDLALNCQGHWMVDAQKMLVAGATLIFFYPFEWHAYYVTPERPGGRVLSIKLSVERDWSVIQLRAFGRHLTQLQHMDSLVQSWQRLIWCYKDPQSSVLVRTLRLVDVLTSLALLHRQSQDRWIVTPKDDVVEFAMHYIEQNMDRLVPLSELARAVHLSPRQLT